MLSAKRAQSRIEIFRFLFADEGKPGSRQTFLTTSLEDCNSVEEESALKGISAWHRGFAEGLICSKFVERVLELDDTP